MRVDLRHPADAAIEDDLTASLRDLTAKSSGSWSVRVDDMWAHADSLIEIPIQGWKLHVSATVGDAESVLRACAPVLLAAGCSFKVARSLDRVEMLTSPHCPRGNAGKVITAYPVSENQFRDLAHLLDRATAGLCGPRILSDRPLCEGSLVHYRYGVFTGVPHVSHDGEVSAALVAPDGARVIDRREAGAATPVWARSPFSSDAVAPTSAAVAPTSEAPASGAPTPGAPTPGAPTPGRSGQVLLGARFAVVEAIRHANRGGVFRAVDQATGQRVVVKQARAHVGSDADGFDVRDRLRHEAGVLEVLTGTGWVPELVSVFEQGGDVFVAEEDLGGCTLRSWVAAGTTDGVVLRPVDETRQLLRELATLVAGIHRAGVVIRDLSPNNVIVTDDQRPVLIDVELAALADGPTDWGARSGTPAYGAPEQFAGVAAEPSADNHSLGATILFALTGEDPYLSGVGPSSLVDWLQHGMRALACPPAIAELALSLCAADPRARPTAADAAVALARPLSPRPALTVATAVDLALDDIAPLGDDAADAAIDALIERLLVDVRPDGKRVAETTTFGETTLATNIQHGAAGILGPLVQAWGISHDDRLIERIDSVAQWLDQAVEHQPTGGPVGLHFGYSGPCWALADAGLALGDASLVERAVGRALALPTDWPGPDVTHGTAGLGLTLVHLWQVTGDQRLRAAVGRVGTHLLSTAVIDGADVSWRTPRGVASSFAGQRFHGFAHGTAGIGLFLHHAAAVTGRGEFAAAASTAAATLERTARRTGTTVTWGSSPEAPSPGLPHWCNGASGVATFLVRNPSDESTADLLDGSARAIVAAKWRSGIAYCHGLSGNADLLLDLAENGADHYRLWASDLLRIMWDRRSSDDLGVGLTDEPGRITPDFNTGYGGALSALLRLRYGGARLWLPRDAS